MCASVTLRRPFASGAAVCAASSIALSAIRASPPETVASAASVSSSTVTFIVAIPRSSSASARRSSSSICSGTSASSRNTRERESRAEITSNDGFSVVAPISVTVPSST